MPCRASSRRRSRSWAMSAPEAKTPVRSPADDQDLGVLLQVRRRPRAARPPSAGRSRCGPRAVEQHHHTVLALLDQERAELRVRRGPSRRPAPPLHALQQHGGALADADAHGGEADPARPSRSIRPSRVMAIREPQEPSGWPRAMAPPSLFTMSGSRPSRRMLASDWVANASLSSTAPRSPTLEAGPLEHLLRGRNGADAHDFRLAAGRGAVDDAGPRRQAEPLDRGLGGHDDGGGAVVEGGGVAGGDHRAARHHGAQTGEHVHGGAGAGALVGVHDGLALAGLDGHGDDLVVEPAGVDGGEGAFVGADGEGVGSPRGRCRPPGPTSSAVSGME